MITIYAPNETDFGDYGLGILYPYTCTVQEIAGGMYELTMEHPIDKDLRWTLIGPGCIIKAPAPLRESPLYEAEAYAQNASTVVPVTRTLYKVKSGKTVKLYKKKSTRSKCLKKLAAGEEVTRLSASGSWLQVVVKKGGKTGWVKSSQLDNMGNITDQITKMQTLTRQGISVTPSSEQFFRVKTIEVDTENALVTVTADQVFYDLHGNLINVVWDAKGVNAAAAVEYMAGKLLNAQEDFDFYCYDSSSTITGEYSYKSPIEFLLDPDSGLVPQTRDMIVRDGWDVYILPDAERDTGVTIRRGKNLIGVSTNTDLSDVVTRIVPVGRAKNGSDLLLDGQIYIDSTHINDYAQVYAKRIDYDVSIVDKDPDNETTFTNVTAARNKLRALVQKDFDGGCDLAEYSMDVDFALLQYAEGYEDYANLQSVHLYDTVTVIDEVIGLTAKTRVVEYEWDCLTEQYTKITLGEITSVKPTTYSFNMPNGGISGSKLAINSVGGGALRDGSVYARNVRAGAIEADAMATSTFTAQTAFVQAMNANALDAVTAHVNEITAQTISTDALVASIAHMLQVTAGNISAQGIQTDALAAQLAQITVLAAGTGSFDRATVQHLVANALNLTFGTGDDVFINNLRVAYAQMVSAAIGNLCVKASDGNYYTIDVAANGNVTATPTTVTPAEEQAGQTNAGRVILGTDITAQDLSTGNLLATYALVNKIDAARIDVDQLFARQAFTDELHTSMITDDDFVSIVVGVGNAQSAAETAQATADGAASAASTAQSTANGAASAASAAQSAANGAASAAAAAQSTADSAASAASAAQTDIDNLSFGTRNYLRNSRTLIWDGVYGFEWPIAVCDRFYCDCAVCG